MFASLKNKIKEETGNDLSKFTSKLSSSTVQRLDSLRGRSHQGSSSSINSIVSSDGFRDDGTCDTEELRKRVMKLEQDFARKLEQKEQEWKGILSEKNRQLQVLEREKDEALRHVAHLRISLKSSEELKQKIAERQENIDLFENLQSQEMTKVKQLVLVRDKELAEKTAALKEANSQLEKLRNEVHRLRRQEEQLSDVQDDLESLRHSTARDLASLATQLAECQEERRHLSDLVVILKQRLSNELSEDERVVSERKLLEQRLEEAHVHLADIKTSWSDKISSLETQVGRLSRQAAEEGAERRRAIDERKALAERCRQLEAELECNEIELNNKETKIKRLTSEVEELSNEIKALRAESEEEVAFLRTQLEETATEAKAARKNLENAESQLNKSEDECSRLKNTIDSEQETSDSLRKLVTKLEKNLSEEKENSLNVQRTLTRVTAEKNTALLRNAEISQQMEMIKQEKRRQELEMSELIHKLNQAEEENKKYQESRTLEQHLHNTISELEEQLSEKNKNIKTLQLRLADMKKTLQQELRTTSNHSFDLLDNSAAVLTPSQVSTRSFPNLVKKDEDDVNFKYLKHVVIKFLTCREYEAQHLIKAIATVLKFTADEEKLVIDTLEWKRSWFGGSRPKLSSSQQKNRNNSVTHS